MPDGEDRNIDRQIILVKEMMKTIKKRHNILHIFTNQMCTSS